MTLENQLKREVKRIEHVQASAVYVRKQMADLKTTLDTTLNKVQTLEQSVKEQRNRQEKRRRKAVKERWIVPENYEKDSAPWTLLESHVAQVMEMGVATCPEYATTPR